MPHSPARRRSALPRFSQFLVDNLLLLPLGAVLALIWVNTAPEGYYRFVYSISFAVNDVAMLFFFGLMTKEVVEATAPGGVLHSWRRTSLPVMAALGAAALPAFLYLRTVDLLDEPMLSLGWPVSVATDIALGYFVVKIIFRQHAIIPFFLLMAIATDTLGFLALALFNQGIDHHWLAGGLTIAASMILAYGLRKAGVKSFWPYVVLGGGLCWYGLYGAGMSAALALVPIVPFLPHGARDPGFLVDAQPTAHDALSRFEIWCRYPAHVTLFFFGLVNAGVRLHAFEVGALGLPIALIVGRPIGVLAAVGISVAIGLRLPHHVTWRELTVAGITAAVGFSVGLFICTALLPAGQLRAELSLGVLVSLVAIAVAVVAAKMLKVGRFASSD